MARMVLEPRSILQEAEELIHGQRRHDYGGCLASFQRIATMWSAYLGVEVSPEDVAQCMVLLKVCRAKQGQHRDSLVDIAGYAGCVDIMQGERLA
jgi:hypothetical protein